MRQSVTTKVVDAIAQRRHGHHHDSESVVQVSSKSPGFDLFLEISVRRRNDSDVHTSVFVFADAPNGASFEHAKQFGLQIERQLTDLVEKNGSAISL
jgi:hypothetical protein